MTKLLPVVDIDKEKCINCYACIAPCPVKFCMNGSGEKLLINHDLCIGCGHCIEVCPHNARLPVDDLENFQAALKRREKIVAIVAPAVASVFPDNYLKLNGYLKSLGIDAVFDVSFGAELTVVSYVNYIKEKKPKMVIAQPCPAIVTYIEIYHPELIPYLAPAHSPMLHNIIMIKEYYPKYRDHKVAVISPCIAKKREFAGTKLGDYNVSMISFKNIFAQHKINLSSFPDTKYEGPSAERAVLFSAPGGLLETAERYLPGIRRDIRKIEGIHGVYPYLTGVSKNLKSPNVELPLLVDCLNCEYGCNAGPGTGNHKKTMEELESPVRKRSKELEKKLNPKNHKKAYKKYHNFLNKFWKPKLYDRSYMDLSGNYNIKHPNKEQLTEVYQSLKKEKESDIFDCTACGYGSCEKMAIAIFNKLNKPDNCAHYNLALLEEERKTIMHINLKFKTHISRAHDALEKINELVAKLETSINSQSKSVENSSAVTEVMVNSLKQTSELSHKERESVMGLIENAAKGQDAMKETVQAVNDISTSVDGIASAIKIISVIAANTNLLAINAAIEAAHAGEAGKGFAVVADEIRRLSESTRENSRNIAQTLSSIISGINTTSKRTDDTGGIMTAISNEINSFAATMTEFINTLGKLSSGSSDITMSLKNLKEHSFAVKDDYGKMLSLTGILRHEISFLDTMSADIVRAIEQNNQEIINRLIAEG